MTRNFGIISRSNKISPCESISAEGVTGQMVLGGNKQPSGPRIALGVERKSNVIQLGAARASLPSPSSVAEVAQAMWDALTILFWFGLAALVAGALGLSIGFLVFFAW